MPYKSQKNTVYKIRNNKGLFWSSGINCWTKNGSIWKSLSGVKSHMMGCFRHNSYYSRFNYKECSPIIVEYTVTESKIYSYDSKSKEFKEEELLETVILNEENLENI